MLICSSLSKANLFFFANNWSFQFLKQNSSKQIHSKLAHQCWLGKSYCRVSGLPGCWHWWRGRQDWLLLDRRRRSRLRWARGHHHLLDGSGLQSLHIYIFNRQNNFGRPIRIIRIMFSLLVFWVYCFVIYFSLRNLTLPNEHVAILQPLNPLIDVTELHKIHRPFDFEAAQLQIVWSGRKGIDYVQCRGYVISYQQFKVFDGVCAWKVLCQGKCAISS